MATLSVSLNKDEENKALELRRALLFCIRERPTCHLDGGCVRRALQPPRRGLVTCRWEHACGSPRALRIRRHWPEDFGPRHASHCRAAGMFVVLSININMNRYVVVQSYDACITHAYRGHSNEENLQCLSVGARTRGI